MTVSKSNPNEDPGYFGNPHAAMSDRLLWVWKDNRLIVRQGRNHHQGMAWESSKVESCFRGWYDPGTNELFLIGPTRPDKPNAQPMRSIPRLLDRVLRRRFGDLIRYRAF